MSQLDWIERLRQSLPEQGRATVVIARDDGIVNVSLCASELVRSQVKTRFLALSLIVICVNALTVMLIQAHRNSASTLELKSQVAQSEEMLASLQLLTESAARSLPFATTTPITSEFYVGSQIEAFTQIIQLQDKFLRFYLSNTKPILNQELQGILASFNDAGIEIIGITDRIMPGRELESSAASGKFLDVSSSYIDEGFLDLIHEYSNARHLIKALPTLKPVGDARTSSGFGFRQDPFRNTKVSHKGVDLISNSAPEVMSTADGQVIFAGWDSGGYGNKVIIDHGNDLSTLYAHLDTVSVALYVVAPAKPNTTH